MAEGERAGARRADKTSGDTTSSKPNAKFATKLREDAENPDEIRRALDDAAGMSRNLWLAFLTFGTYLVIAVASVTHRDLFLESAIKLPLLNVELPLVGFFVVAPLLFIIFHAYLLLNLRLLVDNVSRYNEMVEAAGLDEEESDAFRLLLTNFPFVQLLAGTSDARRGLLGWLLTTIVWVTVVLAPVILLVLMQLKFLPYHSSFVTWVLRALIVTDLVLLWLLWPKIILAGDRGGQRAAVTRGIGAVLTLLLIGFVVLFATFPGERFDNNFAASRSGAYSFLFTGHGGRRGVLSNALVLPDQDFVDSDKLDKVNRTVSLRGRDLRGAILVRADLRKADLTGAHLEGADLTQANLRKADLTNANLRRADLSQARLDEAILVDAQLQEAKLIRAYLGGALLSGARLELAHLDYANLSGINAMDTKGTMFRTADLPHANFMGAALEKTEFGGAKLDGTDFRGARLKGADFSVAGFEDTHLDGALIDSIRLWRTHPVVTACFTSGTPLFAYLGYLGAPERVDANIETVIENISKDLSEEGKVELRRRLDELFSKNGSWPEATESMEEARWGEVLDEKCPGSLAESLIEIACADVHPYVLRGLIANGVLRELSSKDFNAVAARIMDKEKCPGATELTESDKAELGRLALIERN